VFVLASVVMALVGIAAAQRTTGTLRGQVLDPQGAVVVDARVRVTNDATGIAQELVTTSAGTYNVPSLIPGNYTVTVEAKSFKGALTKGVVVLSGQDNVADFRLEMGTAAEVVEVTAGAAEVQTTSSALSNNYNALDVSGLPQAGGALNGSPLNLAVLAPNVVAQPGGVTGVGGSVGGTRPRDNNFTVDGVDDNNLGVTGPNSTVIPDAVAEFSLLTNQFGAEYGHSAGGQFSLVTKTGTNNWHGSGEWYLQNRNLNSLDNLTKSIIPSLLPGKPAYDNNRFGGTVGGPIIKNKWFIFGAYEYTTLHGQGSPTKLLAPTAAGLATAEGMAANSQVSTILSNFPVAPVGNQGSIAVNGQAIPIGDLVIISPVFQREHDFQVNSDYSFGKHQIAARFTYNQEKFILAVNSTQSIFNQNEPVHNRKGAVNDVWSISDHLVNDLRLQYSFFSTSLANPCSACPSDVTLRDLGNVTIGPGDNQFQKQNTYQVLDNLSWAHGKHTIKFGGQYNHFIYPQFFLPRSNGDYWYNHLQTLVNDDIPENTGRTLRNAGSGSFLGTQSAFYGFLQDDFKATPRLTLNLGLRYEFWTNPVGAETQALNAISDVPGVITFRKPGVDYNNVAPRVGFAYDPWGNGKTAIRGGFGISYDVKFQNFASITLPPQLQSELDEASACGLTTPPAWCASNSNFLAGGGLPQVYVPPADQASARGLTTSYIDDTVMPKILTWTLGVQHEMYRNATLELRYLGTRGLELPVQYRRNRQTYFDAGGTALPTYLSTSSIPGTWSSSTVTDTNFYNFIFELDPAFSDNTYQQYGFNGNVTADPPLGNSIYHAGSVNFTQRSRHGLTFNTNYTYSHTIDTATNEFFTSLLNPRRAQDTNRLGDDRANSDLDVRHKFVLSLVYDLPKTSAENRFVKSLVNGFQIGSTFLAQSGQPVTLQSGVDSNGNNDSAGDRVVMNPSGSAHVGSDVFPVCASTTGTTSGAPVGTTYIGSTSYTNAALNGCAANPSGPFAAFAIGFDPAIGYTPVNGNARYLVAGGGALTNVGRNSFFSPGFSVLNLSVGKKVNFSETKYLQVKADVFNILNHPNYAVSNGNVFSVAGVTTATTTPGYVQPFDPNFLNSRLFSGGIRSMTLALKFVF
jgi:hypothetical protein